MATPARPIDLAESVAGEEDPGAGIDATLTARDEALQQAPATLEKPCPSCAGRGMLGGSTCPECEGTGRIACEGAS